MNKPQLKCQLKSRDWKQCPAGTVLGDDSTQEAEGHAGWWGGVGLDSFWNPQPPPLSSESCVHTWSPDGWSLTSRRQLPLSTFIYVFVFFYLSFIRFASISCYYLADAASFLPMQHRLLTLFAQSLSTQTHLKSISFQPRMKAVSQSAAEYDSSLVIKIISDNAIWRHMKPPLATLHVKRNSEEEVVISLIFSYLFTSCCLSCQIKKWVSWYAVQIVILSGHLSDA